MAGAIFALAACGANTASSVQPGRTTSVSSRPITEFNHGVELESGSNLIVSAGHDHMAFPRGASYKRTARGIEVTFKGVTRTFPATATIGAGTYHKYARASQ